MAEATVEEDKNEQLEIPIEGPRTVSIAPEGASEDPDALDPELPVPRGEEVVAVVEALLFSSTTPMNVRRLVVMTNGVPEEEIFVAVEELKSRYAEARCGLMIMEVAGGWQVATKAEVADWVLRLHRHRRKNPLTPALMETLAIIAYKQPITRSEIESVRGVDCGTALRSLQDAGLAEIVGRKETLGKPPLYGTTELFLKTFGLRDIDMLPSLGELKAIIEGTMKREEVGATAPTSAAAAADESPAPGTTPDPVGEVPRNEA